MIKKSVAVFAALLLMTSGLNASVFMAESCSQQAMEYVDAWEYHFGCLTAKEASYMYSTQEALCIANMYSK